MKEIITANNISKSYGTLVKTPALTQVNFKAAEGEFVAVTGRSGSGKSTLLKCLSGIEKPDTGEVILDGVNIHKLKRNETALLRRRRIGFIYQNYNLFEEFTAYENIVLPLILDNATPDAEEIDALMEQLHILGAKDKLPSELSGGEQQKVAIARAFVAKPKIIFADEPTGNLDAASAAEAAKLLRRTSKLFGTCIIMVTHDMQMADCADRIITIEDGHLHSD